MYNEFKTLLMNIDYGSNGDEHIPASFNAVGLNDKLYGAYNAIFPADTGRETILILGQIYMTLIRAAGLEEDLLQHFDPRITYKLDDYIADWTVLSGGFEFNFDLLMKRVGVNKDAIDKMLTYKAAFDTTKYENMYRQHFNPVYRFAGLLFAYMARVKEFYTNDFHYEDTLNTRKKTTKTTTTKTTTHRTTTTTTTTTWPPFPITIVSALPIKNADESYSIQVTANVGAPAYLGPWGAGVDMYIGYESFAPPELKVITNPGGAGNPFWACRMFALSYRIDEVDQDENPISWWTELRASQSNEYWNDGQSMQVTMPAAPGTQVGSKKIYRFADGIGWGEWCLRGEFAPTVSQWIEPMTCAQLEATFDSTTTSTTTTSVPPLPIPEFYFDSTNWGRVNQDVVVTSNRKFIPGSIVKIRLWGIVGSYGWNTGWSNTVYVNCFQNIPNTPEIATFDVNGNLTINWADPNYATFWPCFQLWGRSTPSGQFTDITSDLDFCAPGIGASASITVTLNGDYMSTYGVNGIMVRYVGDQAHPSNFSPVVYPTSS